MQAAMALPNAALACCCCAVACRRSCRRAPRWAAAPPTAPAAALCEGSLPVIAAPAAPAAAPRARLPLAVLAQGRAHLGKGVTRFFITDDDFARNRNWEEILGRIIEMREQEGLQFGFLIQVDAQAYRIPNFVEKCKRAGCSRGFIGLER